MGGPQRVLTRTPRHNQRSAPRVAPRVAAHGSIFYNNKGISSIYIGLLHTQDSEPRAVITQY